jgi:hypothetical protein
MKLKVKKIIAREFLILIATITISFITFLCIYAYNHYYQNKLASLTLKNSAKRLVWDSLTNITNAKTKKQLWFSSIYYANYNFSTPERKLEFFTDSGLPIFGKSQNLKVFERLIDLDKKDSLILFFSNNNSFIEFGKLYKFKTPSDFKYFVNENTITSADLENLKKSNIILNEIRDLEIEKINTQNKIISPKDNKHFVILALLYSAIILFLLRYLFYGISWSINTLKQK